MERKMTPSKLIVKAQSLGSKATTPQGAKKFILDHIKQDSTPIFRRGNKYYRSLDRDQANPKARHRARKNARYTRLGEEMMAALSLPFYDAKKDRARVSRIERKKQITEALASEEERNLVAAGYTLTKDGAHRILAGLDDGHQFNVQVPLKCQTIGEALAWLRPDDIYPETPRQGEAEGYTETQAGSTRNVEHRGIDSFDRRRRHMPSECLAVLTHGETLFLGRSAVKSHPWTGRTRIYARGVISHPEHGDLDLGNQWHEVIPNRAHGPFGVGEFSGGLD
jgi:hypothetical protein